MKARSFLKLKLIIGAVLLLGVLGAGVLSLGVMNHGTAAHHGCLGLSAGSPPCAALADIASCLRVHLGVLQSISYATPPLNQLLVILLIAVVVWFIVKRKGRDPDVLSKLHLRLYGFDTRCHVLLKKIGQWLVLHEKRDPAPTAMVVLGASTALAM